MREASQVCDMEQVNTFIMLRLYSLSKDQSELCDPHDKESILSEVKELTDKVSPFTFDQIMAALDFAQYGRNPQDCEKKGKSRKAVDYIGSLDPVAVHVLPDGRILWFFDSLGRARWVRNHLKLKGFEAIGNYVTEFVVAADGVPEALPLEQQPDYGGEDE